MLLYCFFIMKLNLLNIEISKCSTPINVENKQFLVLISFVFIHFIRDDKIIFIHKYRLIFYSKSYKKLYSYEKR